MSKAWNGWYHVNGNTYGTWLRGDPRGWRTRRHREHVDGDYKHPPAQGTFEAIYERSKSLMTRRAVYLNRTQRQVAGQAMVERLVALGVELLTLSQDASHYHLLARFPDDQVRQSVNPKMGTGTSGPQGLPSQSPFSRSQGKRLGQEVPATADS